MKNCQCRQTCSVECREVGLTTQSSPNTQAKLWLMWRAPRSPAEQGPQAPPGWRVHMCHLQAGEMRKGDEGWEGPELESLGPDQSHLQETPARIP